ncbi:hypothetical protein B0H14DRAFT_3860383, partial [Mycena olivaceomarginata]
MGRHASNALRFAPPIVRLFARDTTARCISRARQGCRPAFSEAEERRGEGSPATPCTLAGAVAEVRVLVYSARRPRILQLIPGLALDTLISPHLTPDARLPRPHPPLPFVPFLPPSPLPKRTSQTTANQLCPSPLPSPLSPRRWKGKRHPVTDEFPLVCSAPSYTLACPLTTSRVIHRTTTPFLDSVRAAAPRASPLPLPGSRPPQPPHHPRDCQQHPCMTTSTTSSTRAFGSRTRTSTSTGGERCKHRRPAQKKPMSARVTSSCRSMITIAARQRQRDLVRAPVPARRTPSFPSPQTPDIPPDTPTSIRPCAYMVTHRWRPRHASEIADSPNHRHGHDYERACASRTTLPSPHLVLRSRSRIS